MCSLLGQRIFKHSRTPKYILPSTIFPIQKYFVSNVTALEDAYENAKAYCKGNHVCLVVWIISYHKIMLVIKRYYKVKIFMYLGKKPPPDVEVDGIFATNELDLKNVSVYGFDYDYTLACYKESVDHLIYNLGRETLVRKLKVFTFKFGCLVSIDFKQPFWKIFSILLKSSS